MKTVVLIEENVYFYYDFRNNKEVLEALGLDSRIYQEYGVVCALSIRITPDKRPPAAPPAAAASRRRSRTSYKIMYLVMLTIL